jgi:hypothetical protein
LWPERRLKNAATRQASSTVFSLFLTHQKRQHLSAFPSINALKPASRLPNSDLKGGFNFEVQRYIKKGGLNECG